MKRANWKQYRGPYGNRMRVRALSRRLEAEYGPFKPKTRRDPLDELILTVLSQHTSDANSHRAFERLKAAFSTWDEVERAPLRRIEAAIRVGGLAVSKSRTIKRVLAELKKRDGAYTLDWIADLPLDEALEALTDLPGVGIKTASCVLLFSFGRPSMPVDTHVHRLARRLGLVARKTTADQTYAVLMAITPEELVYPFHLQLIKHGRIVCKSQRPRCAECILVDLCPSAELIG